MKTFYTFDYDLTPPEGQRLAAAIRSQGYPGGDHDLADAVVAAARRAGLHVRDAVLADHTPPDLTDRPGWWQLNRGWCEESSLLAFLADPDQLNRASFAVWIPGVMPRKLPPGSCEDLTPMVYRRFILWDVKDGEPRWDRDLCVWTSDGIVGRIGIDNAFLAIYADYSAAKWPEGIKSLESLEIGHRVKNVIFRLSGSTGSYQVIRVS